MSMCRVSEKGMTKTLPSKHAHAGPIWALWARAGPRANLGPGPALHGAPYISRKGARQELLQACLLGYVESS